VKVAQVFSANRIAYSYAKPIIFQHSNENRSIKEFLNKKVKCLFLTYYQSEPKAQLQAQALLMENLILMMIL